MKQKIVAISLALVMVLSISACGEGFPPAQEIIDGATQAQSDIKTCQFDTDMTVEMAGEIEGEEIEMTMETDASAALDIENSQMQMDMTMNMAMPGEGEMEMEMEMYFIGNMLYIMTDVLGMGVTWMKSEMPLGSWEEMYQIGPQIEALETAKVKVKGSEIVGGVDCYVLEVTPDMEQLWEIAMQQTEVAGVLPDIDEELVEEVFRDFSFKQWIAKDTYLLTKVEMEMDMEFTPEAMGIPFAEGEINMDMVMTMLMYDYNQPVSIELPPEAEDAVEMPLGF